MKVYGQLEYSQFHNLAANPTPTSLGLAYISTVDGKVRYWDGSAWQTVVSEATSASLNSTPPVGSIVAYNPGYFTNGTNDGFTTVGPAGNTVAQVNAFLPANWRVCDGTALNDSGSTIFNGAGRFLPNLTDARFIMGNTSIGDGGGTNSSAHTHQVTSNVSVAAHTITQPEFNQSGHNHDVTVSFISAQINQPTFTVDPHRHGFAHDHPAFYIDTNGHIRLQDEATHSSADISLTTDQIALTYTSGTGSFEDGNNRDGYDPNSMAGAQWYTGGVTLPPSGAGGNDSDTGTASTNTTTRTTNVSIPDKLFATTTVDPAITRTTDVALNGHTVTNGTVTSGAASATENRPQYLETFYIMRVK